MSDLSTGTEDRPLEVAPDTPSTIGLWLFLVASPVVWITHFMVVYLGAEAACTAADSPGIRFVSPDTLVVAVVVATAVAALATLVVAGHSWRTSRRSTGDEAALATAGIMLSLGSLAAVLVVGLSALAFEPC